MKPLRDTSDRIAGDRFNAFSALTGFCFLSVDGKNKAHGFCITTQRAVNHLAGREFPLRSRRVFCSGVRQRIYELY